MPELETLTVEKEKGSEGAVSAVVVVEWVVLVVLREVSVRVSVLLLACVEAMVAMVVKSWDWSHACVILCLERETRKGGCE